MKRLFSPWRSAYIQTFNEKKHSHKCLFCRMVKEKKDAANLIIWRGKYCFVILNKYPYNNGHLMIIPYRHTASFSKLCENEYNEVFFITGKCINALKVVSKPQGFNFGANLGRAAGAGIDKHIHFHLVPRWNGDTNFMPILGDIKIVSEDLKKYCFVLKKMLKSHAFQENKFA